MASAKNRICWELLNVSSSNSSDEDFQEKPEFPSHGKISTEKTKRKSRSKSVSKENARDSSISSVSSQTAAVPHKARKKRKKKSKSLENVRDSSVANVSNQTSTSSKKKQEKNKSAVEKKSPTNTNDLEIAKRLTCINFPLEANYDFRLVCSLCLVKEKEGPNAFCLKNVCPQCPMDQLAIKKKSKSNWLLVRNRPPFNAVYRICFDFQSCVPCKMNPCTFAHGEGESIMWTFEQKKGFKLDRFIEELRKNNIVTSQRLAEVKSNTAYIPGLSTPISSSPSESHRPGTTPNVNKSTKGLSPATIPTQDGYTKIHVIKSKPIVQPSLEPVPAKDVTNFPALHGRSDTNSIDTSPQLYTVDNPDFTTVKYEHSYTDSVVAPPKKVPSNPSLKPVSVESWPFTKDENPLQKTHDFQMFCSECFPRNFQRPIPHTNCLKNILAFAEKGTRNWLQVRERKKSKFFAGSYVLCKSLGGDPSLCRFGHENCSFAHNTIEMLLWNADKHENFDLTGFIYSHSTDEYRILNFVRKYGTTFSYVCGACFKSTNLISCKSKKGNVCDSLQAHDWSSNKTLFYSAEKKLINKLLSTTYLSRLCFNRNCRHTCSLAHSIIEREVWILLRAADITEEKFVDVLNRYSDFFMVENDSQQDVVRTPCPYKLLLLCKKCSMNGQNIMHKKCGHSKISSGVIYMTTPGEKRINKLPNKIPKNYKFTICQSLKKNKCTYQGQCTFAHSQDEIDVWQWMCFNKIKNLEEVISHQEKQSTEVVKGAASIVQELLHPAAKELPVPHYCQFCSVSCRNQMEWENHCTTTEHNKNVSHDQEQQWNYREPPWNYKNEKNLQLCKKHEQGRCLYSNSLDMHNLCPNAHGIKELEEWKKRFEWRALKMDLAKKPQIMSYIVQLQEMCLNSPQPFYVMSESILDVQLEMNGERNVFSTKKKFSHTWTITVTSSKKELQKVSLLHDKDRLYFTLKTNGDKSNFQVLDAHHCKREGELNHWRVTVNFNGNMYGTFSQRVIFDFGDKPLLFQDLAVDVGTYKELQQLQTIRDENSFLLWTPENQEIILLPQTTDLMNKYKRQANIEDVLSHDVITTALNRHNYVQKMHKLLFLEEFACQQKMARYNLCGDMIVSETIADGTAFLSSGPGTLFGEITLSDELSEDTDIGRLILTSCTSVYIALPMLSSKVYEVEIVTDSNVDFKGQQRSSIYLVLTKSCIYDFGLIPGVYEDVELQFQLNRQSFYLMHFALDNIDSIDIVFPDPVKNVFSLKTKPTKCSLKFLNEEQLIAVKYIVGQRENFVCPFILNGAYGTGKTETLVQATMQLLDTQPNARILICTQCNSSADLFILKHLDEYAKKQKNKNMLLRVYYSRRFVRSVPYEVRKYTLMSPSQDQFRKAEKSDFANVRVVICTLENCHSLIRLQLKGMFTHIFIDEAAQEFEAKVLLPLSLATKDTCVVLSGDHHQMGIKIHSTVARQQGLGISIMQRLFKHYANNPHQTVNADSPLHTLLVHNYRNVKEISQFISKCFYGIATNQRDQKTPPSVSGLKPLQFYAVSGLESHNHNSPSFFNEKEIVQVVDCVVNLASNWPTELGPFNPRSICIVSSYKDQVNRIRWSLRKHSMGQVVVEQVGNVPGKEFDVVIISTVRTSKCLDISRDKLANYCEETEEVDFFVNKKLLNTAMTRAKYSVIVVGDPVALCAYGKCSTIWRIFISHCSKLCSVKPPEITYDVVRLEVSRLLSARERSIHGLGDTNHCVSPNPIQQVPIQYSLCYNSKPDIRSVDPVSKPESSNYVSPNPTYQVSSNNVSPNPTYQVPISKPESANYVSPNPIYQVSSNNVSPNPTYQIPISKPESANYVSPNPIYQVSSNNVSPNPTYQVPISKPESANYVSPNPIYQVSSNNVSPNPTYQVPISKPESANYVSPNPIYQVSSNNVSPNPTYQVPISKPESANYVSPNPIYQVFSNNVSPNPTYQVPISKPESANYVNPNPIYQVSSNNVSPNPTYQVSKNYVSPNPTYQVSSNYVNPNPTYQVSSNYVNPNPTYQVSSNYVTPNPIYQASKNYVNPNPTYQVSLNYVNTNPIHQVPIAKTVSSNYVSPNPTYQVSSNYVSPNPIQQVPISKPKSSNYVSPNPIQPVLISKHASSNYVSRNLTQPVPILKAESSNYLSPNPIQQVPISNPKSSNYVSRNLIQQVPILKPVSSNYVNPTAIQPVLISKHASSNYVSQNLIQEVTISKTISSNYVSPNPIQQVLISKTISSNYVSRNPIQQVPILKAGSSNYVSPNPIQQVPISKPESSNYVSQNPIQQVPISKPESSNYVSPNPIQQVPISKPESSNYVSPHPIQQVPISKHESSNYVSPNPIQQVPISKPESLNYDSPNPIQQVPISKPESSNYVSPNPIQQVPILKPESSNYVSPNPIQQVPISKPESLNYDSPNPIQQVPISKPESSNYVSPNPIQQVPTLKPESSNYVSPNPIQQVPISKPESLNYDSPNPIQQVPISKPESSNYVSQNPIQQVPISKPESSNYVSQNPIQQVPISKPESSNYVSPNPIQQVPISKPESLNYVSPNPIQQVPISKPESSNYVSPNPIQQVPISKPESSNYVSQNPIQQVPISKPESSNYVSPNPIQQVPISKPESSNYVSQNPIQQVPISKPESSNYVSQNPIQQVPISKPESSNYVSPNPIQQVPISKPESLNYVSPNPIQQVPISKPESSNYVSPNPIQQVPISKPESSNYVSQNPIQQVPISKPESSNYVSPNPIQQVPISKPESSNYVSPHPIQQVPISKHESSNYVSPNPIQQVPISKPESLNYDSPNPIQQVPISKPESSNYVSPNPIQQVPILKPESSNYVSPNPIQQVPISKPESSNYVSPNPIQQVPISKPESLNYVSPNPIQQVPISKPESSNYVSPNPIQQVPVADMLNNPRPGIDQVDQKKTFSRSHLKNLCKTM